MGKDKDEEPQLKNAPHGSQQYFQQNSVITARFPALDHTPCG